ncbi:hypothetical protein ACU8NU_17875 [Rhizobium leguminosarum]
MTTSFQKLRDPSAPSAERLTAAQPSVFELVGTLAFIFVVRIKENDPQAVTFSHTIEPRAGVQPKREQCIRMDIPVGEPSLHFLFEFVPRDLMAVVTMCPASRCP